MFFTRGRRAYAHRSLVWLVLLAAPLVHAEEARTHAVFDLLHNRLLAHHTQQGLWMDARSPSFAKYTHATATPHWTVHTTLPQHGRVALAMQQATLFVPGGLLPQKDVTLRMQVFSPVPNSVSAQIGSQKTPVVPLQTGWNTVSWVLSTLPRSEIKIALSFGKTAAFTTESGPKTAAAAVRWIHMGTQEPTSGLADAHWFQDNQLRLPNQGAVFYALAPAAHTALDVAGTGAGCSVWATVQTDDSNETHRLKLPLNPGKPVPLPVTGQPLWLGLHVAGCTQAVFTRVALVQAGKPASVPTFVRPKNVILWLSDNTRVDRLQAWNPNSRVQTPFLDELSTRSARFQVAYAQGNESRVSHASLFTGLYPTQHRMIGPKDVLSRNLTLLSEVAKTAQKFTAAYTSNGYVAARWGFGGGWDEFHNYIHEEKELSAASLVGSFEGFLQRRGSQPFFFFLGSIDAHVSWRAREPWISQYDPTPYTGPFQKALLDPQLDQVVAGTLRITDRDKQRVLALYDSNLSYTDAQLAHLWDLLKQKNLLDDTMLIFTSDHGEEFWEYGKIGHGQSLHAELVHVPLWIYYPPLFKGGTVVQEGVELVDILPTLAEALGVDAPMAQGASLIPLANGVGRGYPRPAVSQPFPKAVTMRLGSYKLNLQGDTRALFRVDTVPSSKQETDELSAQHPIATRFVADALALWLAYQPQWNKSRWGVPSNHLPALAKDLEKE